MPVGASFRGGVLGGVTAIPGSVVNSLDVWYPVNEGSGTPTDAIAGNTLTLSGTTWNGTTSIWEGFSLDHDGTDDESIEDQTVDITGGVSMCGWFYPRDLSTASNPIQVVDTPSSPVDMIRLQQFNGDRIRMIVNDDSASSNNDPVTGLSNNTFYFIAGTAQSDGAGGCSLTTYVWDTAQQVGASTTLASNNADYTTLNTDKFAASSRDASGRYYNGLTDAFGYNAGTVLTEADFEAIWNDTKP